MTDQAGELPPIRAIHLQGGCRAHDVGNLLHLEPRASNGGVATYEPPSYGGAYKVLHNRGLQVVGVDFYEDLEQAQGRLPPKWRSLHLTGVPGWHCAKQADVWSFLAHSAIKQSNGLLWDVASRISQQLRVCDWRLRQISESYSNQLARVVHTKDTEGTRGFFDPLTWLAYLALQGFLVDACVLRDYLAEYRALLLAQSGAFTFSGKITTASSLRKHYLKVTELHAPVDQGLRVATDSGGWLQVLGAYRDLVVHCAPLASAGHDMYAVCVPLTLGDGVTLPSIKLPIPSDPALIAKRRTTGEYFEDPEQNYARFKNALADPATAQDGLLYSHSALGQLSLLAAQLAGISPVTPQMPVLTDKDNISVQIVNPRKA